MMDLLIGGLTTLAIIKWLCLTFATGYVARLGQKFCDWMI